MSGRVGAGALVALLVLTGCDRDRLNQFGTFAAAGAAYVGTFHGFAAETGEAMVAGDSAVLETARAMAGDGAGANAAGSRAEVMAEDRLLERYLVDLGRVDRQATLLGQYFQAVTAVTNGRAQKAAVSSADGLVDAISAVNAEVEGAQFGGESVKKYFGSGTTVVVVHVAVKGLDRDVAKAAPVIDRALGLQEAAVAALTAQMRASTQASLAVRERTEVVGPYVAKGPLPADWAAKRAAYLRVSVALESAGSATRAAAALHQAFRRLVADQSSAAEMRSLLEAISGMADYTAAVRSAEGLGSGKTN